MATSYTLGQATIDLGAYGKLIYPVQVDGGRWYYYWDRSGDGTSNAWLRDGLDFMGHDVLDDLFGYTKEQIEAQLSCPLCAWNWPYVKTSNETTIEVRYGLINGVFLALPSANGSALPHGPAGLNKEQPGTRIGSSTASTGSFEPNPLYDDMLAIWDAYNGTGTSTGGKGVPPGWYEGSYWSATPSTNGHAAGFLFDGLVDDDRDSRPNHVALEVLPLYPFDRFPTVQFSSTSSSANEGNSGSTTVTVQATLSAASTQAVTVPISYSGTATSASDYNNASTSITIAAGQTTGSATFSVLGDTTSESNETVVLTMGTPTNATLGANTTFTHTIVNDDTASAPAQPSGAFLSGGNHIALGSALVNVFGAAGVETVMLGTGSSQVVLDQNVDRVYLSAAPSAYRFKQTGIRLDGFFSVALQNDADGTVLIFPGGSASAKVSAAGMSLGGATVSSSAPAAVSPTLGGYVAPPSGPSTAGVFLGQGANFTAASSGLKIYGTTNSETVALTRGVSDITMDQLVERVQFDGLATSALKFQQQGISLLVFDGTTLLAKVPLQGDADGTLITTTTGTMQAKVSAAGMFLGGA
ncbi:MAG: hypothetical protein EB072_14990, partial [Betaproteobacteria bacterium]|nr:hypothetical protein [Betaproteobacteria bacterium]